MHNMQQHTQNFHITQGKKLFGTEKEEEGRMEMRGTSLKRNERQRPLERANARVSVCFTLKAALISMKELKVVR